MFHISVMTNATIPERVGRIVMEHVTQNGNGEHREEIPLGPCPSEKEDTILAFWQERGYKIQ